MSHTSVHTTNIMKSAPAVASGATREIYDDFTYKFFSQSPPHVRATIIYLCKIVQTHDLLEGCAPFGGLRVYKNIYI